MELVIWCMKLTAHFHLHWHWLYMFN